MQALKPSTRREAWSGGGASCWDGSLSPFLLADLSHSHSVILTVISKINCKSPGTTYIILPSTLESRRPCKFPGYPDQLWATPPGQPKILLFFPGPGRVILPWYSTYNYTCTNLAHFYLFTVGIQLLHYSFKGQAIDEHNLFGSGNS